MGTRGTRYRVRIGEPAYHGYRCVAIALERHAVLFDKKTREFSHDEIMSSILAAAGAIDANASPYTIERLRLIMEDARRIAEANGEPRTGLASS